MISKIITYIISYVMMFIGILYIIILHTKLIGIKENNELHRSIRKSNYTISDNPNITDECDGIIV